MTAKNTARLGLEAFETRLVPAVTASYNLNAGVLTVTGDDADNRVTLSNTTLLRGMPGINVSGVGVFGGFNPISKVVVRGGNGNDTIDARGLNTVVELYGDAGRDVLFGGNKNDILVGGINDDDLYGGAGNDTLRGESGRDGLFGGAGLDVLTGGSNPDRFLQHDRSLDVITDADPADATVEFRTHNNDFTLGVVTWDNKEWSEDDIRRVDRGLGDMHRLTGTTTLLEQPIGTNQIFYRLGRPFGVASSVAGASGWNFGGSITLTDGAFPNTDHAQFNELATAMTTVHEIAHNWHHTGNFMNFMAISSWSPVWMPGLTWSEESKMWFNAGAGFAYDYGTESPLEDWATTFEAVFYGAEFNAMMDGTANDLNLVPSKMQAVAAFLAQF